MTHEIDILKKRAEQLKETIKETGTTADRSIGVRFKLSDEEYFIEAEFIQGVIPFTNFSPLPNTPDFFMGITSFRGRILSIINIKKFLGLNNKELSNLNRVIVVNYNEIELGILADEIIGSSELEYELIQNERNKAEISLNKYIKTVTNDRLIILDLKTLLSSKELIINN